MTEGLFVKRPEAPFEAFQWNKLGDGPEGVVAAFNVEYDPLCLCSSCQRLMSKHGHLPLKSILGPGLGRLICPGSWLMAMEGGNHRVKTPAQFDAQCIPVTDVENVVKEWFEKLGFNS